MGEGCWGGAERSGSQCRVYPVLKESEDGFPMWDDDDVAAYERYYALGTRERVWYAYCATQGCVVAMLCGSDASTSAMAC